MPASGLPQRHTGIDRRELLQVGYSALLGVGLPGFLAQRTDAAKKASAEGTALARPKSVILLFLTGGLSHIDTFDMKPEQPPEIRGEFRPIATNVPGLQLCEHLPRLAARADQYALVRSLAHRENNHILATHHMLTGNLQPGGFFDKSAARTDWPCYAAALDYHRPRRDGVPSGVNLPTFMQMGPLTWPGQHAGFLGSRHDPWQISRDPNATDFRIDGLKSEVGLDRLSDRRALLEQFDRYQERSANLAAAQRLTEQQELAFTVLTSGKVAQAFDMEREPLALRERYGRHSFGQSLLLARRLTQAGVPVVQVNMGPALYWDSHETIFNRLKSPLLPQLDQSVAALLDDLAATGLLDETLVLMLGEFGRGPKVVSSTVGRDHWASCFFGLFAGGGVRGGQVIGRSDKIAAFPTTPPYSPDDVGATVFHALGLDPNAELRDRQNRPSRSVGGEVIHALYTGSAG